MYRGFFKRFLDILFSLIGLILLSPLFLVVFILVLIFLGRPVFFRQERPGRGERIFKLFKFRTMTNKKDEDGRLLPDEKRLTKFGRFLRMTSIDELPELINILKGDMSFIGPRPLLVKYLPYYTVEEHSRHSVRPGLSGLAQVCGRNNLGWNDRFAKDIEYVERMSFSMDVKVFLMTIGKVLKRENIQMGDNMKMKDLDIERKDLRNDIIKIDYLFYKAHKKELSELISELVKGKKESRRVFKNLGTFLKEKSAIVFCYRDKGIVRGVIWAFYITKRRLHINYFVVEKGCRGKGVGGMLLNSVISVANTIDVELLVDKDNKKAISLYEKNGFVKERYNDEKYKMLLNNKKETK